MVRTKILDPRIVHERVLQIKLNKLSRKLERELIQSFRTFSNQIEEDIRAIDDSPQLLNIIRLGNAFRDLCEKIGQDHTHFGEFLQFLNEVRSQDRHLERLIEAYKRKYDHGNPEKFRVEKMIPVDYILLFYQNLCTIYDDYQIQQQELKESFYSGQLNQSGHLNSDTSGNQSNRSIIQKIGQKGKIFQEKIQNISHLTTKKVETLDQNSITTRIISNIYYWRHPEERIEMQKEIEEFRKNTPPEIMEKINQPLPFAVEKACIDKHLKYLTKQLQDFESQGFITHIHAFLALIYPHLEKAAEKLDDTTEYSLSFEDKAFLKEIIRKYYRKNEEWQDRVYRKYENQQFLHEKPVLEPPVNKKILETYLLQYNQQREKLQIIRENKRICRYLQDEKKKNLHGKKILKKNELEQKKFEENELRKKKSKENVKETIKHPKKLFR